MQKGREVRLLKRYNWKLGIGYVKTVGGIVGSSP